MIRIKDPDASLAFYTQVLGMHLIERFDFEEMEFSLYFLGFSASIEGPVPEERGERIVWLASQSGILELTHNYGTESDDDFAGYHDGNSAPQGFGHRRHHLDLIMWTASHASSACACLTS